MNVLQRYLTKTLLETTLIATSIILGLEIFISFLGELRDIGHGNYNLLSAFIYVLLDLPTKLYMLFPMVGLLGILLGLGLLANHYELMVFRVSGISVFQINWMVSKIALLMILVMTIVGEAAAPQLEQIADNYKVTKTSSGQIFKSIHGLWIRDQNRFIHIDNVFSKRKLTGITIYEFDKTHRLIKSFFAGSATYHNSEWLFQNITESNVSEHEITTKNYPEAVIPLSLNPKLIQFSSNEPQDLSLKQLISYTHFLRSNHLKDANYDLAFWQRILQPFATWVMMLLAVPFVFGPLRSTTRSLRLLIGILLGFGFYILNQFFGPISVVYQLPPLFAASLPMLVFALLGTLLSYRANQYH